MTVNSNQMLNTQALLKRGAQLLRTKHETEESTKVGTLRVGNTGCVALGGQVIGPCPRRTLLRMLGSDVSDIAEDRELMFEAGHTNEDIWTASLMAAEEPGLSILRETEIPVSYDQDGIRITGRPDIVICQNGVPTRLLELKLASSMWTCRDVGFQLKPKTPHLLQAGHYMWKLDLPGELWYTNRADFALVGWAAGPKMGYPAPGEPLSERLDYKLGTRVSKQVYGKTVWSIQEMSGADYWALPVGRRAWEPKKILPFRQGFELRWSGAGQLEYRPIPVQGSPEYDWITTLITQRGIAGYYQMIIDCERGGQIPPCPADIEADGSRMSYKHCDYCPLKKLCSQADEYTNLTSWMAAVKQLSTGK